MADHEDRSGLAFGLLIVAIVSLSPGAQAQNVVFGSEGSQNTAFAGRGGGFSSSTSRIGNGSSVSAGGITAGWGGLGSLSRFSAGQNTAGATAATAQSERDAIAGASAEQSAASGAYAAPGLLQSAATGTETSGSMAAAGPGGGSAASVSSAGNQADAMATGQTTTGQTTTGGGATGPGMVGPGWSGLGSLSAAQRTFGATSTSAQTAPAGRASASATQQANAGSDDAALGPQSSSDGLQLSASGPGSAGARLTRTPDGRVTLSVGGPQGGTSDTQGMNAVVAQRSAFGNDALRVSTTGPAAVSARAVQGSASGNGGFSWTSSSINQARTRR